MGLWWLGGGMKCEWEVVEDCGLVGKGGQVAQNEIHCSKQSKPGLAI